MQHASTLEWEWIEGKISLIQDEQEQSKIENFMLRFWLLKHIYALSAKTYAQLTDQDA